MSSGTTRQFFGTDGIRGKANVEPLTPSTVLRLGQAAALTLIARDDSPGRPRCIIGRDTRQSGQVLESAFAAGIASVGVDVELAGVIPTPAIAFLTRTTPASLGVVISASHNPFEDNGIKFFGADGYKLEDRQELEIESRLLDPDGIAPSDLAAPHEIGTIAILERARDLYVESILSSVSEGASLLTGLKVVLDCANGASYQTSPQILRLLGADLVIEHAAPNGVNINEKCGATHEEVLAALVKQHGAAVGIAHDGDADRLLLCDETGDPLDGDDILAIAATFLAKSGKLTRNSLVATVMSNFGLNDTLAAIGGKVIRANVGDRYVIEAMRQEGLNLGGEQSGHLIFHDYGTTGDGVLAAVQILQIMAAEGKPLSALRRCLTKFPQAKRNLAVNSKPPVEELIEAQKLIGKVESELGDAGRVLLRYSGTEKKIRLLIEGRDAGYIEGAADQIAAAILAQIGA